MKEVKKESWRSDKYVNEPNDMYRVTVDMTIREYHEIFKKIIMNIFNLSTNYPQNN